MSDLTIAVGLGKYHQPRGNQTHAFGVLIQWGAAPPQEVFDFPFAVDNPDAQRGALVMAMACAEILTRACAQPGILN